jgi:hypothetical protein
MASVPWALGKKCPGATAQATLGCRYQRDQLTFFFASHHAIQNLGGIPLFLFEPSVIQLDYKNCNLFSLLSSRFSTAG